MEALFKCGEYTPPTLEEAVELCADIKERLDNENIQVIRIGLMASDNINPDSDVTAGPYHPSIGELVQSEIYFRKILKHINKDAVILVNKRDISAFVGNKKCNINKLYKKGFDVCFKADESVLAGEFKILRKEQR